jgi:glycosyltransferase involved in cell wall biosynthesis
MVKVSVVMAVYNGGPDLAATLDSVLAQTETDFELIVIDDGSTDDTPDTLRQYASRDSRMRVLPQPNAGLTASLIRGCAEARAHIIARQDAGDRSLPERFARQVALLAEGHVVVSSAARAVTPEGDTLYITRLDGEDVRRSLLTDDAAHVHGVIHPSVMFRRDAYLAAGGYRPQFRLAQDLDLWVRMAPLGTFGVAPEILYELVFDPRGISGTSRAAQSRLTEIIVALREGGDPDVLLPQATRVAAAPLTASGEAAGLYFMGKCLLAQGNPRGRDYLRRAVARHPLHWRAWLSLIAARR